MKVIFCDIDGVLTTRRHNIRTRYRKKLDGFVEFDPEAVINLNSIVKLTKAEIVITSTWRANGFGRLCNILDARGVAISDTTPIDLKFESRAQEIDAWLENNEVESYVIIDDMEIDGHDGHKVMTDPRVGLTAEDSRKVIEVLRKLD